MHKTWVAIFAAALLLPAAMAAPAGEEEEQASGLRGPDQAPGQSFSHTFATAGRFDYHCHPHPWMVAAIVVQNATGRAPMTHTISMVEPEGKDFDQWTFSPNSLTIEAGDTVTWLNAGSAIHVVQETTAEHAEHIGGVDDGHDDGDVHVEGSADDGDLHAAGAADDGHAHNDSGVGNGLAWILIAIVGGIALAAWVRRSQP